jgi:glutamate 5-kinase
MNLQRDHKHRILPRAKRAVIKIGSAILSDGHGFDTDRLGRLVREICALDLREVVVVSSGAVAVGNAKLKRPDRAKSVPQRQAAAAVGQIGLMALYEEHFAAHGRTVAQILLTHDDLAHRRRYINARHTFEELLGAGAVPVVNENDTVAVEEFLNFGDNDNLSALVATLIGADLLVILSDVTGLHTANPVTDPSAERVSLVPAIDDRIRAFVTDLNITVGTGGMNSKLRAAEKATAAGIPCIIADGLQAGVLPRVFDPESDEGTLFLAQGDRLRRRKHWIAHTLRPAGTLSLDAGARRAVVEHGRSLLPKGITEVGGRFGAGDCVSCIDPEGTEIARGLVNYGSEDLARIKGRHTDEIQSILGYRLGDEVVHRDDLVVLTAKK